jgi:hypothetical protein
MHDVGTLGLPCPDGTDFAGYALYMQELAERIEAETLAFRNSLLPSTNPPTAVWRTVATSGPIDTTGIANISMGPSGGSLAFANYTIGGVGPSQGESQQSFPSPGIYHVGFSILMTETGAVTSGTLRSASMVVFRDDPTGSTIVLDLSSFQAASTSGADSYSRAGLVEVVDTPAQYHIALQWRHNNSGSTMQVNAGDCTIWLTKVGNNDIIEVA